MRTALVLLVLVVVVAAVLLVVRLRDRDGSDQQPNDAAQSPITSTTTAAPVLSGADGGRASSAGDETGAPGGGDDIDDTTESVSTTTSPITPSTAPVRIRPEVPLDQLLLDEIALRSLVEGAALAADDLLGTGPIDIERAATSEADSEAELALLQTRSFEAGFSRAFERDGDIVFLQVYRFGDADDAAAYLLDGADTVLARGAVPYEVGDLPGALGFTEESPSTGFVGHVVTFTVGRHHLLVIAGSSADRMSPIDARTVADAQHAHLLNLTG